MDEKRLQNIETMLSQLIKMVGTIQAEQQNMKSEMQNMQGDTQSLRNDVKQLGVKEEERHHELLARFKDIEMDQDIIWEKASRNEREIEHLKKKLG